MYKTGDLITYGSYGVCKVEAVGTPDISGIDKSKPYYTLCPLYHSEKIYTPIDTNVFMRPVITHAEVQKLISLIPSITSIKEYTNNNSSIKSLEGCYKASLQN